MKNEPCRLKVTGRTATHVADFSFRIPSVQTVHFTSRKVESGFHLI